MVEILKNKLPCGCTPDASGYGDCSECTKKLRQKIWDRMSEKQKNYDRHFAPEQSRALDDGMPDEYDTGCSCHIDAPCSYCVGKDDDDE